MPAFAIALPEFVTAQVLIVHASHQLSGPRSA
jgi:hypothetical protein